MMCPICGRVPVNLYIREGKHGRVKIIAGGCAFDNNPEAYKKIGADFLMHTFKDLKKLRGGD